MVLMYLLGDTTNKTASFKNGAAEKWYQFKWWKRSSILIHPHLVQKTRSTKEKTFRSIFYSL